MQISRRGVIGGAALLAACPRFVLAETTADGFQVLKAVITQQSLLETPEPKTTQWRFSPDPVTIITAKQGLELKLRFINTLENEIWLHWFGVRGVAAQMTINIPSGEANAVDCVFTPPDAGTFWFGPFLDASRQRDMGLYGLLIVSEQTELPEIVDVPLVLDDWKIDSNAHIENDFGDLATTVGAGRMGNWFTVNGRYHPHIALAAGKTSRLRILNAANARPMSLQMKGGDLLLIAIDGQPIKPRHPAVEDLKLQPGQRLDLLLQAVKDTVVLALDLFEDMAELCYLEPQKSQAGQNSVDNLPDNFALPANPIGINFDLAQAKSISFLIAGGSKGGLNSALYKGQTLDVRGLLEKGMAWAVNGVAGPGGQPLGSFIQNETVVVEVNNTSIFDQPLHIHGHVWQVIEVAGTAMADQPWRDTITVPAKTTQKMVFVANNSGTWAIQSTIAERVDAGLLAGFVVT